MTKKEWRPEVSSAATSAVIGLVVLGLFGWCYHWYESTNKKVDQLHEARQEDALKKESEREDTLRALERDVQRHQAPIWTGLIDAHDMSPWITVPAGYGWSFDAKQDVKVHYRKRTGEYGSESFLKSQPGKLIYVDPDRIKIENSGDVPQSVKVWVYQFADTTARVTMPGAEVVTTGMPTKPHVEGGGNRTPRSDQGERQSAAKTMSDDEDYPQNPLPSPSPQAARVVSSSPPGRQIDLKLECGDRQIAMPTPHESPEFSSGLLGIIVKAPRDCWSEWLVPPAGLTPYGMETAQNFRYEVYPADNGEPKGYIAPPPRIVFSEKEREAFQAIRFTGELGPAPVLRILFTKP